MNPLRVCLDARLFEGLYGGVQQVIVGLASSLRRLTDGDEEYHFLVYEGSHQWIEPYMTGPCRLLRIKAPPPAAPQPAWERRLKSWMPFLRNPVQAAALRLGLRKLRLPVSDGAIENAGMDLMHFTMQTAFLTDLPTIYHPHDLQHIHLPQFFDVHARVARDLFYRAYCERARMVAVTASWGKQDLVRQFGLPPDKVRVIPWAPVLDAYPTPTPQDLADARAKFSLPERFLYFPAQTWPHKNHLGVIRAMALLRDRDGLDVSFVSSGHKGPFYKVIEREVRALGLENRVQFLGFVTPLELQCLYRCCFGVVIPSRFEAASFPLWEAFLAGAPAACSNVTSLPAQAGDAALVFEPQDPNAIADAIRRLWRDDDLRRTLVERGHRNVARFTWERTARTFRAHYRRLTGRPLAAEDHVWLEAPPLL